MRSQNGQNRRSALSVLSSFKLTQASITLPPSLTVSPHSHYKSRPYIASVRSFFAQSFTLRVPSPVQPCCAGLSHCRRLTMKDLLLKTQVLKYPNAQTIPLRAMNPTPVYPSRQVHPPGPHPPLHHGSGPCGLTAYEWHVVLIFVILREHQPTTRQARFGVIRVY